MAEKTTAEGELEEVDQTEDETSGGGMMSKLKVGLFVLLVVVLECGAAYFFLPAPEDVHGSAESRLADELSEEEKKAEAERAARDERPMVEVDLGEYGVTSYQPGSNVTLRIDFRLFATVLEDDVADYEEIFTRTENRLRDQVLVTFRNAEVDDLTDPALGLMKRRILETSNRTFGKPLLQEIVFGDFSFIEQ